MYNPRIIQALVLVSILALACGSTIEPVIEVYTVERGEFVSSVTETGELAAVNAVSINSPNMPWRFGSLKISAIVEDGQEVKQGDMLVEFDKSEVEKGIVDAKAELEIALAELRKARATHASQIEDLEAELERTELQHRISQLNLEKATYESEIRRKEIELELEQATISLAKARQEIENQKSINREEISKLELQVQQVRTKLEEAEETVAKLTVTAPAPGIAIIERNRSTDTKYQVDDQLWPGRGIIGLPDLSLMKAEVEINEVDIAKIDTLQPSSIRMDAYPDTSFRGHVSEIAALARNKERDSKVKVFDVTILLDQNDARLMPGMTVSCEIEVERLADTLFIPLEALFQVDGRDIVYLKNGSGFEAHPVEIGQENDDFVLIRSGLERGDQVSLIDPTQFEGESSSQDEEKAGDAS